MAADIKTARPLEYYRKFLEKEIRPDGRNLEEFRPTVINIKCVNTAEGSAIVKLGNTTVMCGIKAEIAIPKAEEPKRGYIVPNIELSPLCSPMFRSGPPGEQAQTQSQFILDVLKHSGCIDCEELCILAGKYVWVLYCDLLCLDYDGNVCDASVLALLAALKNTSLPNVTWNEETEKLDVKPQQQCPLNVLSDPVSSTFVVLDNELLLTDPSVEEEGLATGEVTVVTTENHLCLVRKPGGSPLSPEQMSACLDQAFHRNKHIVQLINETLESVDR